MSSLLIDLPSLQSAENLISLIHENDIDLLKFCLDKINTILPLYWPEFFESIIEIQNLAYNQNFIHKTLAALVAAKLFFYASDLDHALEFALLSDQLFDPYVSSEFNEAIMFKCFEHVIQLRRYSFEKENIEIPARLNTIISNVINDAIDNKCFFHVLGLAIEMRSIEILEKTIISSGKDPKLLSYCVDCVNCSYDNIDFRQEVIQKVLSIYCSQENHSLVDVAQYFFMLEDSEKLICLLKRLIYSNPSSHADLPVALQICFDLYDNCQQKYLNDIISDLQSEASMKTAELIESGIIDISQTQETDDSILTTSGIDYKTLPYLSNLHKLVSILDGTEPNKLQLDFLVRSLKYDMQTIITMQDSARFPTSHTATSICNGLVQLGTTSDTLLRTNIQWISISVGWGRFIMVASLGLIHKGHGQVIKILKPYLPGYVKGHSSAYQEGGALYAIGLAYANCGSSVIHHFLPHLTESTNKIILHGACLGVGLAAMGSCKIDVYKTLLSVLQTNDAISGESSALACGLVMLGSGDMNIYSTLKQIMLTTKHEKIQRGCSLGLSMLFALKTKLANPYIEELLSDSIPIFRLSGVYMVAMSYAGSNDPYAVKTLWRLAASDSHDDVKRASMIALSLVMFREPEQFLAIALLFVQSYNAFLRAGAILSLGIVFTGSGNDKVINLIRAALLDSSLIVRQSAYMSCSMLLIQTNEKNIENYTEFKNMLSGMCTDKHSDNIAKFGAYIGFGIMDVGCRNQAMTFQTLQGHTRIQSIIGILIFQQFWYWFPFVHFLSLCFVPTSIILINPNLEMPQIKFNCDADLNLFSYPIFKQTKPKDTQEKFRVAQLCQTNKSRGKRRNFKDCDPNHITKSLSLRKSRNAHFSQIVLHNEEGKVLSHKSSSHRGILTNKQQHNPPTPISSESATTTESVPTPCPTATATSTSTTDTISVSTPVQTDNKAVETQTQLHSKKTKNEKSLLPLSETKSKSEEQTEENTKDTTITDAVHNLMNPVRALPRQLKYMSIDPSSLPLQTVKAVSCGGIIVCYTENEVDESKLNNISKSDKKPNEEDAPTLEPSENYTTPATATTGLK